jgi:undecaprenyl-diphosphatase
MLEALDAIDGALLPVLLRWHGPWLDALIGGVAFLGSKALVWLLLAGGALLRPLTRAAAWRVLLTLALCYLVAGVILKPLAARPRPPIATTAAPRDLPGIPTNDSFPSDRATAAAGAAVALTRIWPDAAPVWGALAILIGYSVIYIGHHYPTDVIGGYVLGLLLAWWVLGGRHPATSPASLPRPLPEGVVIRP